MEDKNKLFDRLLAEYFSHEISEEDKELLFCMVMDSPVYKEKYENAAKINALLHVPIFEANQEGNYLLLKSKLQEGKNKKKRERMQTLYLWGKRIAAAVVLILISSLASISIYEANKFQKPLIEDIEASTPLGGKVRLILPDGSIVWLNARSELKYTSQFGISDRKLTLIGEAFFEVEKRKDLPFTVCADEIQIIATGTMFNVRSYAEDQSCEVDLLEGGVDVSVVNKSYSLSVDEKLIYNKQTSVVAIEEVDAYLASQWTKGKLFFHQASIPEIYKMLENYFNVHIEIMSDELKEEYFLGSIDLKMSLHEILNYLDVDKKYLIEMKNDIIIVRKK